MVPAIVVPPKLFNMKVLPEVDDVLGTLVLKSIRAYIFAWQRSAGRDREIVVVPAIVVPPKLLNMNVLPEVDDVLGALVLKSIGADAFIDGWKRCASRDREVV